MKVYGRSALLSLCFLAGGTASAQVANNNAPWEMWMSRVYELAAGKVSGPQLKTIQVVTAPRRANWNDKEYGTFYLCSFANQIPALGAEFTPSSANFYDSYVQFVSSINLPPADPSKKKEIEAAKKVFEKEREKTLTLLSQVGNAWSKFSKSQEALPANKRKSYDTWYAESYGNKVGNQRKGANAAGQAYYSLIAKTYKGMDGVADIVSRAYNDAYKMKTKSPQSQKEDECPDFDTSPTIDKFVTETVSLTWDFNKSSQRKTIESSSLGGGGSLRVGFFSIRASGGGAWSKVDEQKENIEFKVTFQNIGWVTILPGKWFSKLLITTLRDDVIPGSPISKGGAVWWPTGRFAWIPKEALVAYRPAFTIKMSQSSYSQAKSSMSGGGGFSVGPFSFGGSGGSSKESIAYDDATNTISIQDLSDAPMILAVRNEPMGE